MSRRRVNVESTGQGFITHGHLFGHLAFLVNMSASEGTPDATLTFLEIGEKLNRSGLRRAHVYAPPLQATVGADLAHFLHQACPNVTVTMAFHAGEYLAADTMVYESVLLVAPGDLFIPADLDRRAGSVSVSYWPGENALKMLTEVCDAPYGYFLVMNKQEIGEAKVWMRSNRVAEWQIIPRFDFEAVEPAELEAMTNGAPRAETV